MSGVGRGPVFTLPVLAKYAGAVDRTLGAWVKRGILVPSIQRSNGSGTPDLFSERDVRVAATLVELRRRGLDVDALEGVAYVLTTGHDEALCPICDTDSPTIKLQPTSPLQDSEGGDDA